MRPPNRLIALAVAASAVAALLTGQLLTAQPATADIPVASRFDAGNIISDQVFFDSDAMTAAQIQSFLTGKTGTCANSRCLTVLTATTTSRAADAMCSAYKGAPNEKVSTIIAKVSIACGINPEVLLVSLQKEQGLVGATAPSSYAIERAMGYACPDTGNGCDPTYAGIYNQIYRAAWQFKRYANPAGTSAAFTTYTPGKTVAVRYSPSSPCGTKQVRIANQATANLYYYTPYTPNAAALANLYGTGDSCSAYGNRNFWTYFTKWFGSPTATGPVATTAGHLDSAAGGLGTVSVRGWALDTSTTAPIKVALSFGTAAKTVTAGATRADVASAYPGSGSKHGFSATLDADPGTYDLCATAIGANAATSLISCSPVTVADPSPLGSVDSVRAAPGGVAVRGWAADPEIAGAIPVRVTIDGTAAKTLTASAARPDVAKAFPAVGSDHGFAATLAAAAGAHTVCLTAVNTGRGADRQLGACTTVSVLPSVPTGRLDSVSFTPKSLTVSGWAADGDTIDPVRVAVYVDKKRVTASVADLTRADIGRAYPAYGASHGYSVTVPTTQGTHSVCVYALNAPGSTGKNALIRCATVTTDQKPVGRFDSATAVKGGIRVSGWAFDPDDTAASIQVAVYVDGTSRPRLTASGSRPDVKRANSLPTSLHGFAGTLTAAAGKHSVCAYAIDTTGGTNPRLGVCRAVTVR
ncbi:hypothetical protein EDF46_3178 [Frondihabitans sp. PhB188]|uniref:hypothetical protein n=1 Tax=Frondihabitans sp. PhB188 TaxID=2485200 RepID=UPI000F48685D|nr:hypothetical protein [Frondihabitans sp. PhB188]ROQ36635.1 hypothetical protein EDF46_3178 [Frondihabitans sp. PhB188]